MPKRVGDLIAYLQEFDPDLIVGLSSDEEGNGINEWSGDHSLAVYNPNGGYENKFSGYIYDLDEDGYEDEETERQVSAEEATAIILWP